jgi:hypothetical protein
MNRMLDLYLSVEAHDFENDLHYMGFKVQTGENVRFVSLQLEPNR